MDSMDNWLGFSISPQELPSQHLGHSQPRVSRLGFNSDEVSGTDVSADCFDLTSKSTATSLNTPADGPFGIFEEDQIRTNHSQDWNMNGLGMNCESNFKTSSELSMFMGGSCSNQNLNHEEPKLEDFLGGHSFTDPDQKLPGCNYTFPNCSFAETTETSNIDRGDMNSNSIGLSMIKTWLRNQPAPPQNDGGTICGGAVSAVSGNGSLSLSMSTGSQSNSSLPLLATAATGRSHGGESSSSENKQQKVTAIDSPSGAIEAVPRKSIDTFGQRTSIYRGVTRHRWTGRYEAHLWDNSCRREGQTRKGRQGGYDKEEKAARSYDLAALKYWGSTTTTNFPISNYEKELEEMKNMTRQEYVASLRRKSSGFSRGASIYRGVTRHHQHGRWQARIGRVAGNKDLYLGTFGTQEEAAEAYDIAAIKFRGLSAVTNFDMNRYDVNSIMESNTLPIGGAAKRLKEAEQSEMIVDGRRVEEGNIRSSQLSDEINNYGAHNLGWPTIAFQQAQPLSIHYPYGQQKGWCKQEHEEVAAESMQDLHPLQLGNSTHNFFQPSVLHNLMSLDSSSLEHSSGSNSVIYSSRGGAGGGGGTNNNFQGYVDGNSSAFVMPMGTVMADQSNYNQGRSFGENDVKELGYENMVASTDPFQGRNLYYLSQQPSPAGMVKASAYDQGSACNNWIPTAVPSLAPRTSNSLTACHGKERT
ncbi:hypothetical protein HHK36_020140 [Tetracentron sinense]|uniref:AP2/ERF domain-containing protein n=1 Tax=Tetracentron sinense TaxID=13715 RepID=A0A834YWT8_TETSI|nr:hypothetical protein HHK36_020140 [Tetracentron sinense]